MSIPPRTKAKMYTKIKTYGNHFHVDDASITSHVTYDSGVVSIFNHGDDPNNVRPLGQLQYVWGLERHFGTRLWHNIHPCGIILM